jgi:hypothetical protein
MTHEERCEGAKRALDKVLTPQWREEVKAIGLDPTGGEEMESKLSTFYDRLTTATQDEGYKGEDIPAPPKDAQELESRAKAPVAVVQVSQENSAGIVEKLMNLLHGKKKKRG